LHLGFLTLLFSCGGRTFRSDIKAHPTPPPSFASYASRMVLWDRTKRADFFFRFRSCALFASRMVLRDEAVGLRRETAAPSLTFFVTMKSLFAMSSRAKRGICCCFTPPPQPSWSRSGSPRECENLCAIARVFCDDEISLLFGCATGFESPSHPPRARLTDRAL
jgi:hypothetical protein